MALIAVVFGAGAGLALVLGILRDVTRSYAHRTDPLEAGPRPAPAAPVREAADATREPARPATAQAGRDALIERRRFAEALEVQARVMQTAAARGAGGRGARCWPACTTRSAGSGSRSRIAPERSRT